MEYGGRHAAILVDDVLLEWTTDDLVVLRRVGANDLFTFEGCVQKASGEYFNDMISRRPTLEEDLKSFQEEGDILCKTLEIKKLLLHTTNSIKYLETAKNLSKMLLMLSRSQGVSFLSKINSIYSRLRKEQFE